MGNRKPIVYGLLFVLAFVFYGNTITNEYAMDDVVVIKNNSFTQQGLEGLDDIFTQDSFTGYLGHNKRVVQGGRYRPLSIATFAIEYEFFGQNPHISHFINVLIYALIGLLIFMILTRPGIFQYLHEWYEREMGYDWKFLVPFFIALIYILHPLHTEAVANIKGRDELFAMLFSLLTLYFSIRYAEKPRIHWLIWCFLAFGLGMLSKENTITFLAVVPLTLWVFTKTSIRTKIYAEIPLVAATLLFLIVRINISGLPGGEAPDNIMNNPFADMSGSERYATTFYTLLLYLKLLFFPHPLTVDYYPYHIPVINWADIRAILPLLIYLALLVYAVILIFRKSIVAYSILFYLVTLSIVSNLFFSIGTFMSERFLFMPSLGFAIFSGYVLLVALPAQAPVKKYNRPLLYTAFTALFIMLAFFGTKAIIRNNQWEDDYTLFSHDVKISTNSAFGNKSLGNHLIEEALETDNTKQKEQYLSKALKHLHKAVKINPDYTKALFLLGNAEYLYAKNFKENHNNFERAFHYYGELLNRDPDHEEAYENIAVILNNVKDPQFRLKIWKDLYQLNSDRFEVNYQLGILYRDHQQNYELAIKHLRKALEKRPGHASALMNLGVAYANKGNWKAAENYHLEAIAKGMKDAGVYRNLQVIYQQLGQEEKAAEFGQKAQKMQQSKEN